MSQLTLQALRYFLVVAEELSVTSAARKLHMAQPPLSQQIQKLERELDCALFVRTSRGMRLTPAGLTLLPEASALLGEADRVTARVQATAKGDSGVLEIGCVPVACSGLASHLVRQFHREHPDVKVSVKEMDTDSVYNALASQTIDVGLTRVGPALPGIEMHTLVDEEPLIALPENHPLASRGDVWMSDLAAESFILYSRKLGLKHFDEFVSACREVGGFSPEILNECSSVAAQLVMIGAGLGVGFVTELTGRTAVPGVVFRRVADLQMTIPLLIAWLRNRENPAVTRFIESVEAVGG